MSGPEDLSVGAVRFPAEMEDRYELLERIGRDLLTTAHRARDRVRNRIVMVRVLRSEWAGNASVVQELQRGLGDAMAFRDSGVVPVIDVGLAPDGRIVFVEDVDRGSNLADRIRHSAPLDREYIRTIAVSIADGLAYVHSRGLAHGDLRPEKVLIGGEPPARVAGFGQSSAVRAVADLDPGSLAITVPYTAPEVATSGPSPAGDIYSVGVMMYEMLTGRLPFSGNPVEIALHHARSDAPRVSERIPEVPPAVDDLVARCLSKSPLERFPDGRSLARALRESVGSRQPGSNAPREIELEPVTVPRSAAPTRASHTNVPMEDNVARKTSRTAATAPSARKGVNWLTIATIASLFLLVGSFALVFSWVKPFLTPASTILVPNLVGMPLTEAEALARERGFSVQVIDRQYRVDPPADVIYQMRDKVGVPIRAGQPVAVWVSKGPEMVEVPDVARMRLDKARDVLERAGLKVGAVARQHDFTEPAGSVIEQAGLPGQRKPRGSAIDLVVSKGPEPEDQPAAPEPTSKPVEEPRPGPEQQAPIPPPGSAERVFSVPYRVPDDGKPHQIRIDVEDADGLHTAYDEEVEAGRKLNVEVTVTGKSYQVRLYDNDVLKGTAP